jgi:hypothetical protein
MLEFLLTSAVIFGVLTIWQYVEYRYRCFAEANPKLGPYRPEPGCGEGCSCSQGSCSTPTTNDTPTTVSLEMPRAGQAIGRE